MRDFACSCGLSWYMQFEQIYIPLIPSINDTGRVPVGFGARDIAELKLITQFKGDADWRVELLGVNRPVLNRSPFTPVRHNVKVNW